MTGAVPEVVFVTREGCHLCADALATVRAICDEYGAPLSLRDVDADPDDLARWSDWVPVVLVGGREVDSLRVSGPRLRAALEAGGL